MKSNILRNIMLVLCVVLTAALAVAAILFFRGVHPAAEPEPEAPVLKVLAPFEMSAHRQAFEAVVADYCALPEKPRVVVQYIMREVYQKEISLQLDRGELADLIICENVVMPALVSMGVYRDISDYITAEKKEIEFHSGLLYNTRNNGQYYGIPFTFDPVVLFYNRQMFARKNISVPKNWDELLSAARDVPELGSYGFGIAPRQPEDLSSLFIQMLYSTGGSIRDVNGANGIRFFELFNDLKTARALSGDMINWNLIDLTEAFLDGQVAMMAGSVSASKMMQQYGVNFGVGVAALPFDKKEVYLMNGKTVGISSTANDEPALDFLNYLSSKEAVEKIADGMDTIPVRKDVDYNPQNKTIALDREFVEKQIQSGISKSSFRTWFDISSTISDGIHVLLGPSEVDMSELADSMQDKIRVAIINQ